MVDEFGRRRLRHPDALYNAADLQDFESCRRCGHQNPADVQFCGACGVELSPAGQQRLRPAIGYSALLIILLSLLSTTGGIFDWLYVLWFVAAIAWVVSVLVLPTLGRTHDETWQAVAVLAVGFLFLAGTCVSNLATVEWGLPSFS